MSGMFGRLQNLKSHVRLHLRVLRRMPTTSTSGSRVGPGLDCRISGKVKAGHDVHIGRRLTLRVLGTLVLGDNVFINNDAHIVCHSSVRIGDRVRVGERVSIHDENHEVEPTRDRQILRDKFTCAPIVIEDDVWIGAGSIILSGVTIGSGSIVGAGSVVVSSITSGVLAAGAPATVKRRLRER